MGKKRDFSNFKSFLITIIARNVFNFFQDYTKNNPKNFLIFHEKRKKILPSNLSFLTS